MGVLIKKAGHEFVYGGHLLSLGASAIVWSVILILGETDGWPLLLLAYLISQIVYNYDHLDEIKDVELSKNTERSRHLLKTKKYQIVSFIVYVLAFTTMLFTVRVQTSLVAVGLVSAGILYTVTAKQITKNIVGFKNFYVAFSWSTLALLVAAFYSESVVDAYILSIFLYIFLRWIVNTTFFDLKDEDDDRDAGLKTLPAVYGASKTVFYLQIVNVISGVVLVISVLLGIFPNYALFLLFFPIYGAYYLFRALRLSKRELRIVSYVMVDGEYLFWPFALLLGKMLLKN